MGLCVTRWGQLESKRVEEGQNGILKGAVRAGTLGKGSEDRSYHPRHHLQESRVIDGIGVITITRNST